jgi:hypothetical protein
MTQSGYRTAWTSAENCLRSGEEDWERDCMKRRSRGVALIGDLAALILLNFDSSALAMCGEKSGPGFRAPDGHCVSWNEVDKTCGKPPTTKCLPERVNVAKPSESPIEARLALRSNRGTATYRASSNRSTTTQRTSSWSFTSRLSA